MAHEVLPVHSVTSFDRPDYIFTGITHSFQKRREVLGNLLRSHTDDQVQPPLFVLRVERIDQGNQFILFHTWADFAPERVSASS